MITESILWEVIGADSFASINGSDLGISGDGSDSSRLLRGGGQHARPKDAKGRFLILKLGLLILTGNDNASWNMCDTNCRIGRINGLTTWPGGAKDIDSEILLADFDIHFIGFGQN